MHYLLTVLIKYIRFIYFPEPLYSRCWVKSDHMPPSQLYCNWSTVRTVLEDMYELQMISPIVVMYQKSYCMEMGFTWNDCKFQTSIDFSVWCLQVLLVLLGSMSWCYFCLDPLINLQIHEFIEKHTNNDFINYFYDGHALISELKNNCDFFRGKMKKKKMSGW